MRINIKASICLALLGITVHANSSELNLNFLHGEAKHNLPDILQNNSKYPTGKYLVDVTFNKEFVGRRVLTVTSQDKDQICFSKEWLEELSLPIKYDSLMTYWDSQRACYVLEKHSGVQIEFDTNEQVLSISIPQILLRDPLLYDNWDYGISGLRLAYNTNISKSHDGKTELYGNIDANLNVGKWVLSSRASGFKGDGFNFSEAIASRAIGSVRGTFSAGKSIASGTLLPSISYYGMALTSSRNMIPWQKRGYAPIISGVAHTNARITIKQGELVLSSQIVPPGAYALNNISPVGNGNITVIVEEEDGSKSIRTYPVTTMPTLLRTGDFNYNFVIGSRVNSDGTKNGDRKPFAMASIDYGYAMYTMNLATVLHSKYQNVGIGITKDLGVLGAVASSLNISNASLKYRDKFDINNKDSQTGVSFTAKYAKGLTNSTNLQLLTYQYTGKEYIDFNTFDSSKKYDNNSRKSRYEAIITQSFNTAFVNFSLWRQDYRDKSGQDIGANISYTTSINDISLSLASSYTKYHYSDKDDYSLSMSVSIPFSIFDNRQFSTNSISYSRTGKTILNSGVSGNINDRVNYSLNAGYSENNKSISSYVGMAFDGVQTGATITKSNNTMSASMSASGSVMVTQPTGILFSREQNSTVAIIKVNDIPNISFNRSSTTNSRGNTAIYVSPYSKNDIKIDTEQVPDNIELLDSIYNVVPTEKAIIYREYKYIVVNRYILRPVLAEGKQLPIGSIAKTEDGSEVGFISTGGILLINVIDNAQRISIISALGDECHFSLEGISPGENKIKEVDCE